jgi:hypothetical protein
VKFIFRWIMDQIKGCPDLPPDPHYTRRPCLLCGDSGTYMKDGVSTICPNCSKPYQVTSDGCAYRDGQPGQAVAGPGAVALGGAGGRGEHGEGGKGGDAFAAGQNSIAIGGKGGDASDH